MVTKVVLLLLRLLGSRCIVVKVNYDRHDENGLQVRVALKPDRLSYKRAGV